MPPPSDLQDIVDNPRETLTVDLKEHIDPSDPDHMAKLAKHICALANYGGGYLLFGFDNNAQAVTAPADIAARYHQDRISRIVATYLTPSFQCTTHIVPSSAGVDHAVLVVPPLHTTPICAVRDGPNGRHIKKGTHYTRNHGTNGPESVPVDTPGLWAPVIRQCVTNDRTAVMGMFSRVLATPGGSLEGTAAVASSPVSRLTRWHDAAHTQFVRLLRDHPHNWPAPLLQNHYQLSYSVIDGDTDTVELSSLIELLRQINAEVRDVVSTGWNMFYPFQRPPIDPYTVSTDEGDALEASLLGETSLDTTLPDVWRVSGKAKATIVRAYREDRPGRGMGAPGSVFNPDFAIRELAELTRHARAMASRFPSAEAIAFRCEWFGLANRRIENGQDWSRERISRGDHRIAVGQWPVGTVNADWPDVVASLASSVMASFDPRLRVTRDWVLHLSQTMFRTL